MNTIVTKIMLQDHYFIVVLYISFSSFLFMHVDRICNYVLHTKVNFRRKFHGVKAELNMWKLNIQTPREFSLAKMWLLVGPNCYVFNIYDWIWLVGLSLFLQPIYIHKYSYIQLFFLFPFLFIRCTRNVIVMTILDT